MIAAIPVKPFAAAKQRLAGALPPATRAAVSKEMAHRTIQCVKLVGVDPLVLAADQEVAAWATAEGWESLLDLDGDLNSASSNAVARAASLGQPWLILHADLPFLEPGALIPVMRALLRGGSVISPSRDGGTTLIGASVPGFRFAYGPSSFQRHLHQLRSDDPVVLVDVRLAIDLDDPSDLAFATDRVGWLAQLLDTLPAL